MSGFQNFWEDDIYGKGRHLNLYPYDSVVSYIFRFASRFGSRKDVSILEIGFGAGNNIWFMAREGFTAAGIEGSASGVGFARRRLAAEGLSADLKVGDFTQLPWADGSFDLVIDRGAITHNPRTAISRSLAEVNRVLKPGGRLYSTHLFSAGNPNRTFGEALGDGAYDRFTGGYFEDIGLTFFATADDIRALHGEHLRLLSYEEMLTRDGASGALTSDYWMIEAEKPEIAR